MQMQMHTFMMQTHMHMCMMWMHMHMHNKHTWHTHSPTQACMTCTHGCMMHMMQFVQASLGNACTVSPGLQPPSHPHPMCQLHSAPWLHLTPIASPSCVPITSCLCCSSLPALSSAPGCASVPICVCTSTHACTQHPPGHASHSCPHPPSPSIQGETCTLCLTLIQHQLLWLLLHLS